jgi:pimeloyl-ACP methyl ester carboxylesterase
MASFVLVHGAFEGGWCWSRVAPLVRRRGHDVLTPTLTGSGERFHLLTREVSLATHIEDIVSVLEHEDLRDVVLVGHSYGGTVITGVADRAAERVARVVYLDASAPVDGQAASGACAAGTSDVLETMAGGEGWLLPPLPLEAFGVTRAEDVAWVNARRHPHPMRTLHEPLRLARGAHVARSYVACARHEGLVALFGVDPLAPFAQRAQAEGWGMQTIDAPHAAMITHPEAVADALLRHV